jgi:predicted phosphodiesterase
MVKVLVISDEEAPDLQAHTVRDLAPDLVLAAGDLPWHYLEWVASQVDAPAVMVPGNHDPAVPSPRESAGRLTYEAIADGPRPHGWVNADQRVVTAAGLRIAGLGGCVRYRKGPHQYTQRQYAGRAARLALRARFGAPVDVLLTHAPPYGLGDGDDGPHVGIEALHGVIGRLQPTWHLHGHIHPYGMPMPDRQVGRTTVCNVIPWRVVDITPRAALVGAAG